MSAALAAAGESVVDKTEFRTCEEDGASETPPATTSYEVHALLDRRVATARSHKWHVAPRLGAQGRGDATNYI